MAKIRKNASIESGLMEVLKILSDDEINEAIGKTSSYIRKCSNPDLAQEIDHNDSFTHNVVHQFSLFDKVECDNYNQLNKDKLKKATVLVFSPGPGNPKNYPMTSKIYKKFKGQKKIIGICLGFQQILFCQKENCVLFL